MATEVGVNMEEPPFDEIREFGVSELEHQCLLELLPIPSIPIGSLELCGRHFRKKLFTKCAPIANCNLINNKYYLMLVLIFVFIKQPEMILS